MKEQQGHENDGKALNVQEEEEVQPAEPPNVQANFDIGGHLTKLAVRNCWREEGEVLESCDLQDCARHTYCAQADVQHVGCDERR